MNKKNVQEDIAIHMVDIGSVNMRAVQNRPGKEDYVEHMVVAHAHTVNTTAVQNGP